MRVLVVEDDRALGMFLQKGLKLDGHVVDWVGDGDAALARAELLPPKLMVLDLGLPQRDGTEVLAAMRQRFPETSILILTGRGSLEERVHCLDIGADDFLLKPFSLQELVARCRALLRRRELFGSSLLRFGALEMDRMSRRVRRDGVNVELTAKEFALLEFLLKRRGICCSREELLREVWQMSPDSGTNVVDVYVNYLRKKMAAAHPDGLKSVPVIETVRGQGYRISDGRKTERVLVSLPVPAWAGAS
jgi:DNA-binding response OmpR family regulator